MYIRVKPSLSLLGDPQIPKRRGKTLHTCVQMQGVLVSNNIYPQYFSYIQSPAEVHQGHRKRHKATTGVSLLSLCWFKQLLCIL